MTGKDVALAAELLRKGGLVAIPTETVYGLAGIISNEQSILDIFKAKKRPAFDPLIVHIADVSQVDALVKNFPEKAKKLASAFWPGPLTLLLEKSDAVPDLVTSGNPSVAVRIPSHPLTLELLRLLNEPVAAPSANPFGYVSPTSAKHVEDQLSGKVDYILDGGSSQVGLESTIVSFLDGKIKIVRLGGLEPEAIETVLGEKVPVDIKTHSNPNAPGQLDKHYATHSRLILTDNVEKTRQDWEGKVQRFALLSFSDPFEQLNFDRREVLSSKRSAEEAARNLFAAMRRLDAEKPGIIIAERFPEDGLGAAINDRLYRASQKETKNLH